MSRRIPGRRPALVGSAQLRSSANQGRTPVPSVSEVEPGSLDATDRPALQVPADTASVGTRARRLASAAPGSATQPADPNAAAQPIHPSLATQLTDLSPATQSADLGLATQSTDVGLAGHPADLGLAGHPADLGLAGHRADLSLAGQPTDLSLAAHPADLSPAVQPADPSSVAQPTAPSPAAQLAAPTPAGVDPDPGPAEVDTLWTAYLQAPTRSLRDRLVVHYTPLVRAVAHRVAAGLPPYVDQSDLVQSGVFGLIDAVIRFDPARCPRFESYAAQRIRGAILDELRAQDWVPRSVRGRAREMERAQERLEGRLLRGATDRELAAELGVSVRDLAGLSRQVQLISVEALFENSGGVSELLADDDAPDPMAVVQARETLRHLSAAVKQLGERDQTVIRLYYLENRTLAEIGSLLGVTESRVCQLHTRLVGRLRGRLEELAAG
jgi:RNA polymerase sigma factor FliA